MFDDVSISVPSFPFFTEDVFNKYNDLVRRLQNGNKAEHQCECNDSSRRQEKQKKYGTLAAKDIRRSRPSALSAREQARYLELWRLYQIPSALQPTDEDLIERRHFQELERRVHEEQALFQELLEKAADDNPKHYHFIERRVIDFIKVKIIATKNRVWSYAPYYRNLKEITLNVDKVSNVCLKFEVTLHRQNDIPQITRPVISDKNCLQPTLTRMSQHSHKQRAGRMTSIVDCSSDPRGEELARLSGCHYVLPLAAYACLTNNCDPHFSNPWQLPVIVKCFVNAAGVAQKIIFVDKPLWDKDMTTRQKNDKFYNAAFKLFMKAGGSELRLASNQRTNRKSQFSGKSKQSGDKEIFDLADIETFGASEFKTSPRKRIKEDCVPQTSTDVREQYKTIKFISENDIKDEENDAVLEKLDGSKKDEILCAVDVEDKETLKDEIVVKVEEAEKFGGLVTDELMDCDENVRIFRMDVNSSTGNGEQRVAGDTETDVKAESSSVESKKGPSDGDTQPSRRVLRSASKIALASRHGEENARVSSVDGQGQKVTDESTVATHTLRSGRSLMSPAHPDASLSCEGSMEIGSPSANCRRVSGSHDESKNKGDNVKSELSISSAETHDEAKRETSLPTVATSKKSRGSLNPPFDDDLNMDSSSDDGLVIDVPSDTESRVIVTRSRSKQSLTESPQPSIKEPTNVVKTIGSSQAGEVFAFGPSKRVAGPPEPLSPSPPQSPDVVDIEEGSDVDGAAIASNEVKIIPVIPMFDSSSEQEESVAVTPEKSPALPVANNKRRLGNTSPDVHDVDVSVGSGTTSRADSLLPNKTEPPSVKKEFIPDGFCSDVNSSEKTKGMQSGPVKTERSRRQDSGRQSPGGAEGKGANSLESGQPDSDDVDKTYEVWTLGDRRLLLRFHHHGFYKGLPNKETCVNVRSKLEYQSQYGLEQTTLKEAVDSWITSYIRQGAVLVRARIDVFTSGILFLEETPITHILPHAYRSLPAKLFQRTYNILSQLDSLDEGEYLLSHAAGSASCTVRLASHQPEQDTGQSQGYDLHASYVNFTRPATVDVPWVPLDPKMLLPDHWNNGIIPATFMPQGEKNTRNRGKGRGRFTRKR